MIVRDSMFGFELRPFKFNWKDERPKPPAGYIEFNSNRAHCQSGKCPNCGKEKPGKIGLSDVFQDRQIQNLWRALKRMNRKYCPEDPHWKPSYELFSLDIDPDKDKYESMIKCHPSRYGTGEFTCCGAKIWHDFHSKSLKGWKHYYKPTANNNNTLQQWC